MEDIKKIDYLIIIGFLLAFFIAYNIMSDNQMMSSNFITISFVYVFAMCAIEYGKVNRHTNALLVFICISLVFINVSIRGLGDFDYYKKAIMFSVTLIWMDYTANRKISKLTAYVICVLMLLFNISYQQFYESGFELYEGETLLTLNFSNPNLAGMYILNTVLFLGIVIFAGCELINKKKWFILHLLVVIPIALGTVELILLTGCRSAIMSFISFVILAFFDYFLKNKVVVKKWMVTLLAIMPFAFVFFYLQYADTLDFDVSFGIENAGKSAYTRLKIWEPIVNNFFNYFVCGDYYGISGGTGVSQMHNTHLDIYASYGIIPLILYVSLLSNVIWDTWNSATSKFQRVSLYAFVSTLVVCTFEAGFVSGSAGVFLLTCGFLVLANTKIDESTSNK